MNNFRPKTIFCDIDGTLIVHSPPTVAAKVDHHCEVLPKTIDNLHEWDRLGYNIILVTGRKESMRTQTERQLLEAGIIYDKLIMGLGGGDRILINDRKPDGRATAWTINQQRDEGLAKFTFENLNVTAHEYFKAWAKKDIAALGCMFDDAITLKDWNISKQGKEQVLLANQAIFDSVQDLEVDIHDISHSGNIVFAQIVIRVNGEILPVVDILEFNNSGKIKSITAYRGN